MVESPRTCLRVNLVRQPVKDSSSRAHQFARLWLDHLRSQSDLQLDDCFVEIDCGELPAGHSGLGSGTQLAQSTAAGINRLLGLPPSRVIDVARVLDRGQRSLIGSLGFEHGGLIVDRPLSLDTKPGSSIDYLAARVALPDDWRVLLIRHPAAVRTFGDREKALFSGFEKRLCPEAVILESWIENAIVPAATSGDFAGFCQAVYEYGRLSGEYYRAIQGGPYNGPFVTGIVEKVRSMGVCGVGQSSWGPVVFAWCSDQDQANAVAGALQQLMGISTMIEISQVRNLPAEIELN